MTVVEFVKNTIENLNLTVNVLDVEIIDGNTRLTVDKTWYLSKYSTLNGDKITDFKLNEWLEVDTNSSVVSGDSFTLPTLTFVNGKYSEVHKDLNRWGRPNEINPMVWLFELQTRQNGDWDDVFDTSGDVRLFFLNSDDYTRYDTADRYKQVIEPMRQIIFEFQRQMINSGQVLWDFNARTTDHAKFETRGEGLNSDGKQILGFKQSGIEWRGNIKMLKKDKC